MSEMFSSVVLSICLARFIFEANGSSLFHGIVVHGDRVINQRYDYVIVGGGTSGLVVANRLSEDANIQVLVIEPGQVDQQEPYITIPALYGNFQELGTGTTKTHYDWNLTEIPQAGIQNRSRELPAAKVVGGGTVMNGMDFLRGSVADYQRWVDLGNPGWSFEGLLPYFIKSETFNRPSELLSEWDIRFDPAVHGFDGPTETTFPPFQWPSTHNFINAMKELNVSFPEDGASGDAIGAFWIPLSENPKNGTRWSARNGYDSVPRSNLHILTGNRATKLLAGNKSTDGVKIIGVEFAESTNSSRQQVLAGREVILAAGSLHTPQILKLSGIGDPATSSSLGIKEVVGLPGVGENHQDHPLVVIGHSIEIGISSLNFSNATWNNEQRVLFDTEGLGPYTTIGNSFLGFLPVANFSNSSSSIYNQALVQDPSTFFNMGVDPTVLAGYNAQFKILTDEIISPKSAFMEIIWNDEVTLPGLQKPFSRGSVSINTTDPFAPPVINTRVLSNPLDVSLLIEGIKFTRDILNTEAVAALKPNETFPGFSVSADSDLEAYIRSSLTTLNHHIGTSSMLPLELGGVVDSELRVYGTTGLRIVDASIMPMLPAAHLQATVYAVAEKAADIIKVSYA